MRTRFHNIHAHPRHDLWGVLRWKLGLGPREESSVSTAEACAHLPRPVPPDHLAVQHPDAATAQVTWIGHATFLLQVAGWNILIDPVFSDYCFPVPLRRFRRLFPPGVNLDALPPIDAVLITHAHYDHLDLRTLARFPRCTRYYVPHGLRSWLQGHGFPVTHELEWWSGVELAPGLRLHACPAQHFSARLGLGWNRTGWCGWVVSAGEWRVYFAGDTGYCPELKEIPKRIGAVALAVLPIGAYRPRWLMRPMHLDPEDAVQAHLDLGARHSLGSHWGTFDLTADAPGEAAVELGRALDRRGVSPDAFQVLRIGQTFTWPERVMV